MSNLLGKLKNIIGGNEDYQYYEDEIEEMATDFDVSESDPFAQTSNQIPPIPPDSSPSPSSTSQESSFKMPMSSEPLIDERNLASSLPSNVIGMPGISNPMNEVVVIEAHSFEEIPRVIQTLKEQRCVVLNLNVMNPEEAQRAVDFVAGGTYAIDGHQERIGESIFLFTPRTVRVSNLSGNSAAKSQSDPMGEPVSNTFDTDSIWNDPSVSLSNQIAQ